MDWCSFEIWLVERNDGVGEFLSGWVICLGDERKLSCELIVDSVLFVCLGVSIRVNSYEVRNCIDSLSLV